MAPIDRPVPRFAAEPPQDDLPAGPWESRLREVFLAACERIDTEGTDLGEPGELHWFPDRTFDGRTFHPATARTSTGLELFGHVSYLRPEEVGEENRFTLLAPDGIGGSLEIAVADEAGAELARELLYDPAED